MIILQNSLRKHAHAPGLPALENHGMAHIKSNQSWYFYSTVHSEYYLPFSIKHIINVRARPQSWQDMSPVHSGESKGRNNTSSTIHKTIQDFHILSLQCMYLYDSQTNEHKSKGNNNTGYTPGHHKKESSTYPELDQRPLQNRRSDKRETDISHSSARRISNLDQTSPHRDSTFKQVKPAGK